jgi:hypothetical protein
VEFLYADIGATEKWGKPNDRSGVERWPEYVVAPWLRYLDENDQPDLIYIDGRFRVACGLFARVMFELHGSGGWHPKVIIHDFGRPEYQRLLASYEELDRADKLAVLRPKPADMNRVLVDVMRAQFDWR